MSRLRSQTESSPNTAPAFSHALPSLLVVEDDEFLRDLLVRKLEQEGFQVTVAVDGNAAMRILQDHRPGLVLLDLVLPGIDGFVILKHIRSAEQLKGIPVIVLSNLGQREDVDRALRLGADDYIVKAHFTPAEIIKKLKHLLRERYVT